MATETRRKSARLAALSRHHGVGHPYTEDARRDLRFTRLAAAIREAVDEAPPLTLDQLGELRSLLGSKGSK